MLGVIKLRQNNVNDEAHDNNGVAYVDHTIVEAGPDGYFSTLPIRKMVDTLI